MILYMVLSDAIEKGGSIVNGNNDSKRQPSEFHRHPPLGGRFFVELFLLNYKRFACIFEGAHDKAKLQRAQILAA